MHFIITTLATAIFTSPGTQAAAQSLPDLSAINPLDCMTFSVSGVGVDVGADGLSSTAGGTSELSMTLTLKSGTLIRVSF